MKRVLSFLLILAMLLALAACGKDDGLIHVGVISGEPGASAYRTAQDADLRGRLTEARGYSAAYTCTDSHDGQLAAARQMIKDKVDYLLISAVQASGWEDVLRQAQKKKIPVIFYDCDVAADESLYAAWVRTDLDRQSKAAVEWLEAQALSKCRVIHLQETAGSPAQLSRTAALDAKLAADETWSLVARGSAENARQTVQSVIDGSKKFNVIYAESDELASAAIAALDDAGISHGLGGDVTVISFGGSKAALNEMLKGYWNCVIQHSPFYASSIHGIIQDLEAGTAPAQKVVFVEDRTFDANTVTVEDVEDFGI